MKYFGTYTNGQDLVPKSYIDDLLFSHSEPPINVAYRVVSRQVDGESKFAWDNCYSEKDYTSGYSQYVALNINPEYRRSSLYFTYDSRPWTDPDNGQVTTGFPVAAQDVVRKDLTNHKIYYVLQLTSELVAGRDITVDFKLDQRDDVLHPGDFDISNSGFGIRILIPESFYFYYDANNWVNAPIYYNGKQAFLGGEYVRNGYIDIGGYDVDEPSNGFFLSATLNIYTDGDVYYINSCPFSRGNIV